jgi:hypothetical protein
MVRIDGGRGPPRTLFHRSGRSPLAVTGRRNLHNHTRRQQRERQALASERMLSEGIMMRPTGQDTSLDRGPGRNRKSGISGPEGSIHPRPRSSPQIMHSVSWLCVAAHCSGTRYDQRISSTRTSTAGSSGLSMGTTRHGPWPRALTLGMSLCSVSLERKTLYSCGRHHTINQPSHSRFTTFSVSIVYLWKDSTGPSGPSSL